MSPSADPESRCVCENTKCAMVDGVAVCLRSFPVALFSKSSSGKAVDTAMVFDELAALFEKVETLCSELMFDQSQE